MIVGFNLVLEVIHITCNIGSQDLPDMYAISPQASGIHISGKSLLPMLQPIYMLHESDFNNLVCGWFKNPLMKLISLC